jgi:hypothetical protein
MGNSGNAGNRDAAAAATNDEDNDDAWKERLPASKLHSDSILEGLVYVVVVAGLPP